MRTTQKSADALLCRQQDNFRRSNPAPDFAGAEKEYGDKPVLVRAITIRLSDGKHGMNTSIIVPEATINIGEGSMTHISAMRNV